MDRSVPNSGSVPDPGGAQDPGGLPGEWLAALPDHPGARAAAAALASAPQRVDHPSGRPWLLGRWSPGALRAGTSGTRALAVLGFCSAGTDRLRELAARTGDPVALDAPGLAGSFHLLASVDGVSRVQGTVSGLRRVFHADVGGIPVAATRADVLACLTGAEVDRGRLAVRLLVAECSLTSLNEPLWTGVRAVGEDCCLLQYPGGRTVVRRRWTPPTDDRPFPEAARALRAALTDAVRTRVDHGLPLTADLSGGLDSTSLCFLASRDDRPLTTISYPPADVGDEDPVWAARAAEHLPHLSRLLIGSAEIPSVYSDLLEPGPRSDEPFPCVEDRPIHRMTAARLRAAGSGAHMTGEGGDETLVGGATGVFELARRRPWTAWRYLRAYRAFEHWRWRDIAAAARERRTAYPAWLAAQAGTLAVSPMTGTGATNSLTLLPWATAEAAGLARDRLLTDAAASRQHGRDWTTHRTIWAIRHSAALSRAVAPMYAAEGILVTSPYFDDTVIDACMSAPAHLRSTPWTYKALLRAAMSGVVPDECLARTTKAEGSSVEYAGLRANVDRLAALCERSRLGELGLIDAAALRDTCVGLSLREHTPYAISLTMGHERWLRDLEIPTTDAVGAGVGRAVPSRTNGASR